MVSEQMVSETVKEAPGLPQLDFTSFPNQIFWLIIALGAIYIIMSKIALPRIADILDRRQSSIDGDIARADELRQSAEDAQTTYGKALQDAHAQANDIIAQAKVEILNDLNIAIEKADVEIGKKAGESEKLIAKIRANALASVEEVARQTAEAIVTALSPAKVDKKALDAAIASHLKG